MTRNGDQLILSRILKSLVTRDSASIHLLETITAGLNIRFSVRANGSLICGEELDGDFEFILEEDACEYGKIICDSSEGKIVADLIKSLVKKEFEKKRIGSEVLGLYREINMIYNFSAMISEKIDDISIAETALKEASQIIDTTHGSFFLLDTEEDEVIELASFGENPNKQSVPGQQNILKGLISRGTAAIVPSKLVALNPALNHLKSVMFAPLKVKHRSLGLVILGHENEKEFTAAELKLLTTIAIQSAGAIESAQLYQKGLREAREREEAIRIIHEASQKFVPHEFIKSLGKERITEVELGDQVEREVTVMFVDIREFTTLSESMAPKENFFFINSFNKRMGPIVRANEGLIMQYLGDGFMALFPKGAQYALRASVQMQEALKEYNCERISKNRTPVKMGVGMQNGKLIMGITGDVLRMDAAIISDTVNTAARIEGLSKFYGTSILLTKNCLDDLTDASEFNFRYLGPVKVKGKEHTIDLYECIDGDEKSLLEHKLVSMNVFERGMDLFFKKEFAMAAVTFQEVLKQHKEDYTAKLFLNRAAQLITQEIEDDWKGVVAMDKK
ncbi:adenylate/guanylate cyclase domain-containing protein [Gramella sp. KN1008]|uniref:adenylate/guanylate cyclase domain-containing protein n=1 Tax=Gramella sp. KN1008 TaxID=2529298 RepID=UPI00103DE28C|nr:adenylate/guanylate cyclase domain-containing protein [Gramella sp. KN1008]TBW30223.1 GAF domain-containing protein [Gramella sp. KN1008]